MKCILTILFILFIPYYISADFYVKGVYTYDTNVLKIITNKELDSNSVDTNTITVLDQNSLTYSSDSNVITVELDTELVLNHKYSVLTSGIKSVDHETYFGTNSGFHEIFQYKSIIKYSGVSSVIILNYSKPIKGTNIDTTSFAVSGKPRDVIKNVNVFETQIYLNISYLDKDINYSLSVGNIQSIFNEDTSGPTNLTITFSPKTISSSVKNIGNIEDILIKFDENDISNQRELFISRIELSSLSLPQSDEYIYINKVYDISVITGKTYFDNPVELTISFNDINLSMNEMTNLVVLNCDNDIITNHKGIIDGINNTITISTYHFSKYLLAIQTDYSQNQLISDGVNNKLDVLVTPKVITPNNDSINDYCSIQYSLKQKSNVTISIYNIIGELVKRVIFNTVFDKGQHVNVWTGNYEDGNVVQNGIYILKVEAETIDGYKGKESLLKTITVFK